MQWFSRMTLRARVLTVGTVLTVALVLVGTTVQVPYVAEGPGVTYDTLGVVSDTRMISFDGPEIPESVTETFPSPGHLNMTTLSVTDGLPLFAALGLWVQGDYALVPREDHYPPGVSVAEVTEQNAELFRESQTAAEIAALNYLDYPQVVYAGNIIADSPSSGKLQTQDRILEVDGTEVTDAASLQEAMGTTEPGSTVAIVVDREGETLTEEITLGTHPQDPKRGFIGIEPQQRPYAPFDINITLDRIGGPSAGLMFTLGIIDKLTAGDLTNGTFVAGTGEIKLPADGSSPQVARIGGILLKLIAARDAGATVFLVPAGNCEEAVTRIPEGLHLAKVATLDDAMDAMHDLQEGRLPPAC